MTADQIKFDIDESQIKIMPGVDGALRKKVVQFENFINGYDGINHNGVPDIQEFSPMVMSALPALLILLQNVNIDMLVGLIPDGLFENEAEAKKALKIIALVAQKTGNMVTVK